jgi:hypothetical protein
MTTDAAVTTEDRVRILRCDTCGPPLEEIPWSSDDPNLPAEYDDALLYVLSKHKHPSGEPHIGRLIVVEKRAWEMPNLRRALMEQIWKGSRGIAELDLAYYDVRDQLRSDALACFQRHLRPTEGCPDWRSDSKRVVPDTKSERKDVGLATDPRARPAIFLCDLCPCRTFYERKSRGD